MTIDIDTWVKVAAFTGGGLAMGFGAIGAAIGEGYTASKANEAISRNPDMSGDIFKGMLVGQAIAESASIFALVIAMILLFTEFATESYIIVSVLLAAGLSMGLGAIGPGVGEGMVAAKACESIGKNPKEAGLLTRTMLVGQAVSESTGIYSRVIALLLLFVV